MAITFVDKGQFRSNGSSSPSVSLGSSIQVGDLIFVALKVRFLTTLTAGSTTGWTVLVGGESSASQDHIMYKLATSAGSQTVSFGLSASLRCTMAVTAFRGTSSVSSINASGSTSVSNQSLLSFAQPTTTVSGCMIYRVALLLSTTNGSMSLTINAGSFGGGYLDTDNFGGSPVNSMGSLTTYELQSSAGVVGSASAQLTGGTSDINGYVYAIKPDQPPTAPSSISLTTTPADTTNTVNFTRGSDPESDAVFTEVEVSTDGGSNFAALATSASNASTCAVDFTGVAATTTGYLRLRSRANGLFSSYATYGPFTIQHAPSAPAWVFPTAGSTHTIGRSKTLDWLDSTDPNTPSNSLTYAVEISTNNQSSWSSVGTTSAGVTQLSYDFSGKSANSVTYLRVKASDGSLDSAWSVLGPLTLATDVAPGAPTSLSPSSGAFDIAQPLTMTWVFNDPGDTQGGYTIDWGTNGISWPNTATVTSTTSSHTFSASTFSAGNVYVRVKTKDAGSTFGPYAQVGPLTASTKPSTPTITSPTNGGTSGSAQPTVTWTSTGQASYELSITTTADVQLWTSGLTASVATSRQVGLGLQNGTSYKVKLYIKNSDGLASDTASNTFTVTFTTPGTPTLTISPSTTYGYNLVTVTNPTPLGSQPAATYNEIWRYETSAGSGTAIRIATGVGSTALTGYFKDRTASSGVQYSYYARAFAASGLFAQSAAATATLTLDRLWLHAYDDPINLFSVVNPTETDTVGVAGRFIEVDGANDPLFIAMARSMRTISVKAVCNKTDGTKAKIEALMARMKTICVRDGNGNKIFAGSAGYSANYTAGAIEYTLDFTKVRYTEADQTISTSETSPFNSTLLNNCVAFWPLDEVSAGRNDFASTNHLTDTNSTGSTTGIVGTAASFTAASSQRLSIADNANLSMGAGQSFTVSAWVKPTAVANATTYVVAAKGTSTGATSEYLIQHAGTGSDTALSFKISNGTTTTTVTWATNLTASVWYHVVVGYDATNGQAFLTVNNATQQTAAHTSGAQDGSNAFTLGSYSGGGSYYTGQIDAVGVWKRVLTAAEITELYNSGAGVQYPFRPTT